MARLVKRGRNTLGVLPGNGCYYVPPAQKRYRLLDGKKPGAAISNYTYRL